MPKKKTALTIEERLQQALVPAEEQPYEVPENWVWVRLGAIAEIVTGGTPSKKHPEYYGGNFPFYKPSDLDQGRLTYDASEYLSEEGKNVSRIIPKNSTAVCCIGSIGKCGYLMCEGTTNQQINSAIPKINSLCLYYYLCTENFVQDLLSMASATTIAIVNKSKMESCAFPLPPLSEQQRIEELLAKLDEAKERLQEVADSFAVRKAAILHNAFTGELTKQWRRENGVRDESWEEKKLSEITENQDSKRIPLSKSQRDNMNRIYDYYGASGIIDKVDDYIFEGKKLLIGEDGANLVTRSKDIAFIADGKYWVNNHAHILDVKDTVLLMYLCNYVNNMDLIPYVTGSAQPKLTQAKMNNIKIFLPTLPEQHEIVRLIDDLLARERAAQQAAEQALASIDLMKKSILARAFRGELGTNKASEASALELLRQVLS